MTIATLMGRINTFIIDPIILLLFSVAFLYFVWGITMFIWRADSEDARKEGTKHMLWGIIGMFIMIAAFGIIKMIENTFGL